MAAPRVGRRRVIVRETDVRLTPKEFELLALMARPAGQVLTKRTILKATWGPHAVDQSGHVRVLMGQLPKKIEPDPARPRCLLLTFVIQTCRLRYAIESARPALLDGRPRRANDAFVASSPPNQETHDSLLE